MTKLSLKEIEAQIVAAKAYIKSGTEQLEVHKIVLKAFEKELILYNTAKKAKPLNKTLGK